MSNTYNYRQREPSKEIAGSVSILRVKPRTESERVNATVKDEGMRDVLAGGIWTLDNKCVHPDLCDLRPDCTPRQSFI
eukprot:3478330-Pleurochrysis_carterae.AAC.1